MTDKDTIIASQEAEILRLQQGFDDLKGWAMSVKSIPSYDEYDRGVDMTMEMIIEKIDQITGESND